MRKKAIILDLDNTIYPVKSIGDRLFEPLFRLISASGEFKGDFREMASEIMRRPFQWVADDFGFSAKLKSDGIKLLSETTYDDSMESFSDYKYIREIPCRKFLVTTGFTKMQYSKIKQLGIEKDFEGIFVIDSLKSDLTKKDIFLKILTDYNLTSEEVLVVGDDLNSEIKAGQEAGIDTVLYDYESKYSQTDHQKVIRHFGELQRYTL